MEEAVILDADSIAYKAAAANEAKSVKLTHKTTGDVLEYDNRTAAKKAGLDLEEYDVEDIQEPRHIQYAQTLVRDMIKNYKNKIGIQNAEIYISGDGNFRDDIPLPAKHVVTFGKYAGKATIGGRYKSNREDSIRPVQLKALRQWMIDELGAIVVNGQEVDDMSSIRAYAGAKAKVKIVQNTEDKDALGCTGWLYNPAKDTEPRYISGFGELHREKSGVKGTGRLWFYYQVLYGDSVDGYHGVDLAKIKADKEGWQLQFGEVAAYNILKDAPDDKTALKYVYDTYLSWYPEPVTYTAWDGKEYTKDACDIMQMYIDCAHMRRWEGDRIDCRAMLTKLGIL